MEAKWIALDWLSTEGVQTRAGLRESAVAEYAQAIREGGTFEPAVVYRDGTSLHLAAGHHRLEAYRAAGKDKMPCIVREGTAWDAIKGGIKDNLQHRGERLTRADRRHNAELVLRKGPGMSDRAIGDLVGLSHTSVGKFRREMGSTGQSCQSDVRVGRDGRATNTHKVGGKPADERPKEDPGRGRTSVDSVQVDTTDVGLEAPAGGGAAVDDMPQPTVDETPTKDHPLGADEDLDWCRCGAPWESDGEGEVSCPGCGASHPTAPSEPCREDQVVDDVLQPVICALDVKPRFDKQRARQLKYEKGVKRGEYLANLPFLAFQTVDAAGGLLVGLTPCQ